MSYTRGQVFFEKSRSLASAYQLGDDPRPLQLAFASLFDEAAQAIYRAGSDLDEVLVERLLIVRRNHESEFEAPADFLADAELLKKSVLKSFGVPMDSSDANIFEIVAVKIIARQDELAR
jgi:hypothetical protein